MILEVVRRSLTYLTDLGQISNNYLNGHDGLITWITTTFPTKNYYNNLPTNGANRGLEIKTKLLSILS